MYTLTTELLQQQKYMLFEILPKKYSKKQDSYFFLNIVHMLVTFADKNDKIEGRQVLKGIQ